MTEDITIKDDEVPLIGNVLGENVPLEEIFEEEVPLAGVPQTGVASGSLQDTVLIVSALCLAVLALLKKRRENH